MKHTIKGGLMVGGVVLALVMASLALVSGLKDQSIPQTLGLESFEVIKHAGDVIGSRSVTTTVGVDFEALNQAAGIVSVTSTYPSKIGGNSLAVYNIQAVRASTTARINLEFQASNDDECTTTATSGGNLPLASEINWFDIGDHLRGKIQSTTWTNVSSTNPVNWLNPWAGAGKTVILENLNYECIRLNIAAASTTVWATLSTKQ